jgi:hypothetical protein
MTTNVIRYKVAKSIVKMQNSQFAESVRKFDERHPKAIPAIGGALLCIEGVLITMLVVGEIMSM